MDLFNALPQLEELKLSGCSIPKIDPGVFSPLKSLKIVILEQLKKENLIFLAGFEGKSHRKRLRLRI